MAGESEGDDAVLHRSGAHHYSPIAGELAKLSWTHHQHHDASASEPSGEVGPEEADEEAARLRLEAVDRRNAKYLSRAFFVQMVAQREIEVSEDKWQEVLQRQARLLAPVGSLVAPKKRQMHKRHPSSSRCAPRSTEIPSTACLRSSATLSWLHRR